MKENKQEDNEFSGGCIMKECPDCGQYCKVPEFYECSYKYGAWAISYCKRCKKEVRLGVEFL